MFCLKNLFFSKIGNGAKFVVNCVPNDFNSYEIFFTPETRVFAENRKFLHLEKLSKIAEDGNFEKTLSSF